MIANLRQMLRRRAVARQPAIPHGRRVYAVGDIHGRLDLFAELAAAIEEDDRARNPVETTIILLGDLVDRGPDSAGVVDFAREWRRHRRVRVLLGNHEEMLLGALDDIEVLRHLLRHGGRETLLSFGIAADTYDAASYEEVQALMRRHIGQEIIAFLRGCEDMIRIGDYAFVHAGIMPGRPLDEQTPQSLRWIREPFLGSADDHGAVIIHGHTISDEVVVAPNRIGIDTGAFQSGRLTALALEGTRRWLIATDDDNGTITIARHQLN